MAIGIFTRGRPRWPLAIFPLVLSCAPGWPARAASEDSGGNAGETSTTLPAVQVQARAPAAVDPGSSLEPMSSAPLAVTPLAVDRIDAADLLDRGVTSLSSAIRTDPSAGDNYNTFGYIEALQVRGFTLDEFLNYERDGMPVSSHVPVALENKETVEILKGVSGMLAGASSPGGMVNYVLKQPTEQDLREADATVSERGSVLLHADLGGRAGPDRQWGYRINLAAEDRHPEIDHAWSQRTLVSGFFDWRAAAGTLWQAEFEHQRVREISVPGYGLLAPAGSAQATTLPPPIDPTLNLNAQPWTQPFESTQTSASLRLRQRLTEDWELALRVATQRSVANDRVAFPDGCSVGAVYVYNGLCGNYDVDVYQYISDDEVRNTNGADARIRGRLRSGALEHEVTLGARTTRYSERYPPDQTYNLVSYPNGPVFNVFAQTVLPPNAAATTPNAPLDSDLDELYAYDVARLARVSLWLGARAARITQDSALTDDTQATRLQQHLITPWAGLGWEPWAGGFAYASAGSGVEVNNVPNHPATLFTGETVVFVNPGQVLPAQRSRQVELGFKQRLDPDLSLDSALFRIEKPFPDNVPVTVAGQAGAPATIEALQVAGARVERHQGAELQAQWLARPDLRLQAGAMLIDARTIQAVDPAWVGKPATNVAPLAVSLQDFWSPAVLGGADWRNVFTYAGHKAVLPDGSVDLPDYWQWDTALHYEWSAASARWTLRAGIDNVTNRRYWREAPMAVWGSIYLFPAAARSGRLGLAVNW